MRICSAELLLASEKFEFITKECGIINKECSVRDLLGLRGGYPFVRFAAVANQLAAA